VVTLAILLVLSFAFIPEARDTEWLALPLAALFVCMVGGFTLALACLDVLFRDVEHLVASLLLPWFFLTPILYSFSQFGHETLTSVLYYANPITPPIEAIRDPLWAGHLPRLADVVYLVAGAAIALALGAFVFRRVDDRIAVEL
jgi:ABC-type polysaccharide/polyol phosphate export permease